MASNKFVGYIIAPPQKKGLLRDPHVEQSIEFQTSLIEQYISQESDRSLVEVFIEKGEKKRNRANWPALLEAIELCRKEKAQLVIAELRNLTNNDNFTKLLKNDDVEFYCCDQPLVTKNTLSVVAGYQKNLRKIHGELIRKGLERTTAKSGNPNAKEVISKVNRPKIEQAIIFALLMQPLVADFKMKGFSQRKMVKELNDMGFTAPEGGKWVLSQLQKVLDRVRLNELALDLEMTFLEFKEENLSTQQMADELNSLGIAPIRKDKWDERQVEKTVQRIKEIHDILRFNEFVLELMPIINQYRADGMTDNDIIAELQDSDIEVPDVVLEEIA